MPLLQKRFSLFIYLLLFFSTTKADNPSSQNRFEFLTSHENATLVDNGLTLAKGIGEVSLSTVINTGIWWAVCKAPGFISEMAHRHPFTATEKEKQELVSIKSDFCLQLAPLIATTETILAGQVSPWPIAPLWWRSIFLTGAGLAAYSVIANHQIESTPQNIAAAVLAYLAADGFSRTAGSATSTEILTEIEKTHIDDNAYDKAQYSMLALMSGLMMGSIIYEMLLHTSVEPARAGFISVISAIAASTLSQTISTHNAGFNIRDSIFSIATTGVGAGAIARFRFKAKIGTGASVGAIAGAIAGATAGATAGTVVAAVESAEGAGAKAIGIAGVLAVGLAKFVASALSIIAIDELAPDNVPLKIARAATIATGFALLNSLSGFDTYGYPLERSLSETTQTLWNKFLAPSDYLATLFPQLFSESEHEL